MGISKLKHDLITNKGIRGWDYEGGVSEGVVLAVAGDPVCSNNGGSLMNFGTYSTYYATAFSTPIMTITEPYQNATKLVLEKSANDGNCVINAYDEQNNLIHYVGSASIAPLIVANLCNDGDPDLSNVNVSLGVYSYLLPGSDYHVEFMLACPITKDEAPFNEYSYYCSAGYLDPWFYDALDHWTDGDRWDPDEDFDPASEAGPEGGAGGGGAGGTGTGIRSHKGMAVPSVPSFSGATTGLMSVYACSPADLQSVANTLWDNSGGTDWTDTLVKNYISPFDNIIGLSLLPFEPTQYITGTSANVKVGNYDTGVSSTKLSNTFAQINLGSVSCPEAYKTFADYDETKVDIYLPFIGIESLNVDDVMDSTVSCVYNVDVLSGVCVAYLTTDKLGVFASFAGNMKCDLPLSGVNYANAIQGWAVQNFGAGGTAGDLSRHVLEKQARTESGQYKWYEAEKYLNPLQYKASGMDISAPKYKRSGSIGSSGALMGIKQPFLIFTTPRCWSGGVKEKKGYVSNLKVTIGSQSGFISSSVNNNQLSNIACTNAEKEEIKRLLSQGIYV